MIKISIDEYGGYDSIPTYLYFNVFIGPTDIPVSINKLINGYSKIKEKIVDKNNNKNIVALTNDIIAVPLNLDIKSVIPGEDFNLRNTKYLINFIKDIESLISYKQESYYFLEGFTSDRKYYQRIDKINNKNHITVKIGYRIIVTYQDCFNGINSSREVIKTETKTIYY